MKFTSLFLISSLSALAFADDQGICQKKNGNVVAAIQQFCDYSDIVVPSNYANTGTHVGQGGNKDTTVHITGNCSPGQWVPHKYCLSQFYNMCAQGAKHGDMDVRLYGRNNCQHWHILVGQLGTKYNCKDC